MARDTAILEFLGTGTSTGVPIAGCTCWRCRSTDPHDTRLRSSVRIAHGKRNVIIDTGPEFRIQCLRSCIQDIDSVLITHDHADHLHGLDDLRAFSLFKKKTLPVWANRVTLDIIRSRFSYIWNAVQVGGGLPDLRLEEATGPFVAGGMTVTPIPIKHGRMDILGYRIGDLAYMTDISAVPDSSLPLLEGLGTMVVSMVRHRPHPTHLHIAGVKRLHKLVKPKQTLLTHLTHWFTHKELIMRLPVDISPAYDGMKIEITL
ncbi:MAG: MBL fold metallo-hydrolase [Planctomycetaceae bacterium]|nr:MBL fold metallo-hydrolase [Planctomycetaceae bacterium]